MLLVDGRAADVVALWPDDPVLWSGLAIYETLRTYGRRPWRVDAHLARLASSAALLGLRSPPLDTIAEELVRAAGAVSGESKLNVLFTGGGTRVVRAVPLDHARVGAPVRVATRPWSPGLPPAAKHTARAAWDHAARLSEVDEIVWVADGEWLEAHRGSVFAIRDGAVWTPPADGDILPGVTRAAVLEAASIAGLPVVVRRFAPRSDDALYVVSTLKELAPVRVVDAVPRTAAPPPARLLDAFHALTRR